MLKNLICASTMALAWTFTVEATQFTLNPTPGEVSKLNEIIITPVNEDWSAGNKAAFTLTGPEGVEIPKLKNRSTGTGWRVYFDDDAVLTTPGEYVFTIPAGRFIFEDNDAEIENVEESFVYVIVDGDNPGGGDDPVNPDQPGELPDFTITPQPGEYDVIDDGFTLVFDASGVQINDQEGFWLDGPEGDISVFAVAELRQPKLIIAPVNADGDPIQLTSPGKYTLIIASEAISVDGVSNAEPLVFEYVIAESAPSTWNGEYTADPADNSVVESLKEIKITFVGATSVTISETAKPTDFPALIDLDANCEITSGMAIAEGNVLKVSLYAEVTTPGNYMLIIPEALFQVNRASLADGIALNYVINSGTDSIESIIGDATANIYDLSGVKVLEQATANQAKALPAGIYVAKGKKFLVK